MRQKHVPLRSCVACRTKGPKQQFDRVVRTPDAGLAVNPDRRVHGRGAYLCPKIECWNNALTQGRLAQALRGPISPNERAQLLAQAESRFGARQVTAAQDL